MIGCRSVLTTSTLKPSEASNPETNSWAPFMPSLNFESVDTLGWRMNSFSFSTGSNIRQTWAKISPTAIRKKNFKQASLLSLFSCHCEERSDAAVQLELDGL